MFDLGGKTAVITGGGGVLGGAMAQALAQYGAEVVLLGRRREPVEAGAAAIVAQGGKARWVQADVTDEASVAQAFAGLGEIHILLNAAGGTHPKAIASPSLSLFELDLAAMRQVMDLNWMGTVIPCLQVCKQMVERGEGSIINIASMSSFQPVTRNGAYSNAKAALKNFTEWLAVHMAQNYSPGIRVNAIAPGFFLAEQNRNLLIDAQTGALTPRGESMVRGTPMGRLGEPADLGGAAVFLAADASRFITGITIPVDGGYLAFGGV